MSSIKSLTLDERVRQVIDVEYKQAGAKNRALRPQGPHSQILVTGGSDRGSYIIPKKITTSEFVYPKKSLLFLAYPKNVLSPYFATPKNPSFFRDPKNPGVFHRPKKSLLAKILNPKNSLGPLPPPSLKYVGGAPELEAHLKEH